MVEAVAGGDGLLRREILVAEGDEGVDGGEFG